jgi:hypothetical protein
MQKPGVVIGLPGVSPLSRVSKLSGKKSGKILRLEIILQDRNNNMNYAAGGL